MRLKLSKSAQKGHEIYQNDIWQKVKVHFRTKTDVVEKKHTQDC